MINAMFRSIRWILNLLNDFCCRLRWSKPTYFEVNFKELINKIQHPPFLCVFYRGTTVKRMQNISLYKTAWKYAQYTFQYTMKVHTCLRHTLWSSPSITLLPSPVSPRPCLFLFSEPAHLPTWYTQSLDFKQFYVYKITLNQFNQT